MKTLQYKVVYREGPEEPQQEAVKFTQEAANALAWSVYVNGGVAIIVEESIDDLSGELDHGDD